MYSFYNFKILADLQEELDSLKMQSETISKNKVHPSMKSAIEKLFKKIIDISRANGLEISQEDESFVAQYKKATIGVNIIRDGFSLKLSVNNMEVDEIRAIVSASKYISPQVNVKPDELENDILNIQKEIQDIKGLLSSYENLNIIFVNKNSQTFRTPEELIKQYFG